MKNNNSSIKPVVAVGIGAALFFVLGRFVAIPSPVPNTNISLQYAVLALLAAMYGPVVGGLIGFIGHTLIDLSWGGSPWWSWVIASAFVGVVVGLFCQEAEPAGRRLQQEARWLSFAHGQRRGPSAAPGSWWPPCWISLIYAEPVKKVFAQGAFRRSRPTVITAVVVGGLLVLAYTRDHRQEGLSGSGVNPA